MAEYTAKEFWTKLALEAGVPQEQVQAAEQALGHEGFRKKLSEGFLRHDDYSRQADELRTTKASLQTWYQDAMKSFNAEKEIVAQVSTQLNTYRDTYGDLTTGDQANGKPNPTIASPVTGDWVSKKDFDTSMARMSEQAVELMGVLTDCGIDYYSRFNDRLPIADLKKFALEKGLPLSAAYDAFIRPKLDEKSGKEFEEKLKRAREEGAREALSKHNLPVDTRPPEPHFLFDRKPTTEVPQNDHERVAAFTDFCNSPEMAEAARK